jgi:hypothetical protein
LNFWFKNDALINLEKVLQLFEKMQIERYPDKLKIMLFSGYKNPNNNCNDFKMIKMKYE